jgi:hypothetical protein
MTFMSPAQGAPRYAFEFGPPASSAVHANVPLGEVSRANARFDDLIDSCPAQDDRSGLANSARRAVCSTRLFAPSHRNSRAAHFPAHSVIPTVKRGLRRRSCVFFITQAPRVQQDDIRAP